MRTKIFFALILASAQLRVQAQVSETQLAEASQAFLFSDFGSINRHSLETNTIPAKVTLTALVLEGRRNGWIPATSTNYQSILQRFGFFTPKVVLNSPASYKPDFGNLPMGLKEKDIRMGLPGVHVSGMNVTCVSCHAGRLYDETGAPTNQAWMGLPNTSVNFEGYTTAIYRGVKIVAADTKRSHHLMKQMFPGMSKSELATIKLFVYRQVKSKIGDLSRGLDQPLPFSNGGPGVTNGVAALKFNLDFMDKSRHQPEFGFTSIPALGDRFLRSSFLYDGVYAVPGVERFEPRSSWTKEYEKQVGALVALFTIPTMGQSKKGALAHVSQVATTLSTILNAYEAPNFPGDIDYDRARGGYQVYGDNCARCHGNYEWTGAKPKLTSFPNKLVGYDSIGTDPARADAIDRNFVKEFNKTSLAQVTTAAHADGYVAPLLNSLWATAPYLHNASVPTLWDLMHPETRPKKFLVGGHHLDYQKMGLKLVPNPKTDLYEYPADVKPWSLPVVYDTTTPGRSNNGHVEPFDRLTEAEKQDLIEYLKLL